jgi:hypothetical protein
MADATQELMLRVRGDNSGADKAIAGTKTAIDGLNVSGQKAKQAFTSFSRSLSEARDASDVAASAANSLSTIVGRSLMGAFAVGGIKIFTDQINRMGEDVKAVATTAQKAFDDIEKAGQAMSLAEARSQVSQIDALLDSTNKKLADLDRSPFQNFIAGATGARDAMEDLVGTSQKLRDVKLAEGIASENANAQHLSGLDKQQLAIAKVNEEYVKRSKLAQTFTDAEAYRIFQEESAAIKVRETNAIIDKGIEERTNKEREASDIRRKNAMDEFQLEIDGQNRKTEAESKAFFEKLDRDKQVLEQIKKIEEAEQKLNDLVAKRVELEDALVKAKQNQTIRQGELSTMTAGVGGSLRGPGQRQTSSEIGINRAGERAYQNEINRQAERYDQGIAEDLYIQKSLEGLDPRVSKSEIQNEKQRRVEQAKREEAKKRFEDSTKKETDKAKSDLKRNQKEIDSKTAEIQKLKGEKGLGDVYTLLDQNLKEMRTYAFVK